MPYSSANMHLRLQTLLPHMYCAVQVMWHFSMPLSPLQYKKWQQTTKSLTHKNSPERCSSKCLTDECNNIYVVWLVNITSI